MNIDITNNFHDFAFGQCRVINVVLVELAHLPNEIFISTYIQDY
jgi:hypothetical protein